VRVDATIAGWRPGFGRGARRAYALVVLLLGVIVFGLIWLLEPAAMQRQEDPLGEQEQAREAMVERSTEPEPSRLLT
jgi:hypothetical protein